MPNIQAAYRHILPWFLPGVVVFVLLGALLARPVARIFRASTWLGFFLVVSFGIIISATLTPLHGDLNFAAVGGTWIARTEDIRERRFADIAKKARAAVTRAAEIRTRTK